MPEKWEKSANREPRKAAPKPRESLDRGSNGVSQKKVDYITSKWKLLWTREKFKKAKEDTKVNKTNRTKVGEALKDDLNIWVMPGEVAEDDKKAKVDTEAHDLKTLEESLAEEEKDYQEKMESMLKEEKWKIDESDLLKEEKEKKIVEVEREYIDKYATDMELGQKKSPDLKYVAKNFPSAWKETLLNPESIKNPELHKVREEILTESKNIQKNAWEQEADYQKRLLDNFHEQTGLNISQAEFEKFMWIKTETQNTVVPSVPPNAPAQASPWESSNSWVTNASQQAPAQRSSGGWSGNNSSWGGYSSSGGWGWGWSGSWEGYSSGGSSTGGWSSSWSSSTPSESAGGGQEANINYAGWNKKIMDYALAKYEAQDTMGAKHCTDWVVKVFKNAINADLYDLTTYNWVRKVSGWTGYWGTPAGPDKIANIVGGKHLMLDKPPYWSWKTHSVITLWPPDNNGVVSVVSYSGNGTKINKERYDLNWQWRWDKDGKVIRIQGV